jgi:methylated-DNA-[protein]-cysteine S-methyltransferase
MSYFVFESPIGDIGIETDDHFVTTIDLLPTRGSDSTPSPLAKRAMEELKAYFAGTLKAFTIPFPIKGTPFKQACLKAMLAIPYGQTISYQELAAKAGNQKACRAAGTACATNVIPLIIPCHRIIKSDHSIGRFASRSDIKLWLIEMEKSHC